MNVLMAFIMGIGAIALVVGIWLLFTLIRTFFASLLVWLGWTMLVWVEVLTVEPSFWPVVGIGFCLALIAGFVSGGGSSNSD
jgi:hypothetical protein